MGGRSAGLMLGVGLDAILGDPRRFHPVAGFGQVAARLEKHLYGDSRANGTVLMAVCVGGAGLAGAWIERRTTRPITRCLVTAAATWAVLGGTSLGREGLAMARHLEAKDLPAARRRLSHLCARDPSGLDADELARATVESVAENTSDAVVAPLFWGAVAGVPGLLAYRAVNTLDAMVGYKNARYERFGWASARLDDVANWVPARVTGILTVLAAPVAAPEGRRSHAVRNAFRVLRRDGARHPSPNAGRCEAAAAGALDVRLGGANTYGGRSERRPELGDGPPPTVPDIRRAVRLSRAVGFLAAVVASAVAYRR